MSQDNTINADVAPVYILRKFAWEALKANTDMVESDYGGITPIVPLSEEPELQDTTKPYLVYGYATDSSRDLWAHKSGSMTFAIYDQNFRRLTRIVNVLEATFERLDDTANEINKFTTRMAEADSNDAFIGIRFTTIRIGFVEGGTPEIEEGGRQSALFNIRYSYITTPEVKRYINGDWSYS